MRHIRQREDADCTLASTAMLLNIPYSKVTKAAAKGYGKDESGVDASAILRLVRKLSKSNRWEIFPHKMPIPFRHFRPRRSNTIVFIGKITNTGNVYLHATASDGKFIHDPAEQHRIRVSDAQRNPSWRDWFVFAEIARA